LTAYIKKAYQDYREDPEVIKGWKYYVEKDFDNKKKPRICDITTAHIQALVKFVKKLPGFSKLTCEDQIALVKGSCVGIFLLRSSCNCHLRKVQLVPEQISKYGGVEKKSVQMVLDFCAKMKSTGIDETEYGILTAVILFDSDYKYVQNKKKIDSYREVYLCALSNYTFERQKSKPNLLAKILNMVTNIQSIYPKNSFLSFWKEGEGLSPLLMEIFKD